MFNRESTALPVRPRLNIGAGFDVPTGNIVYGLKGEAILNGGYSNLVGFTGVGNSMKTLLGTFFNGVAMVRYTNATGRLYDSENTFDVTRPRDTLRYATRLNTDPIAYDDAMTSFYDRMLFDDDAHMNGNQWFTEIRTATSARIKDKKSAVDTPFRARGGGAMAYYNPHLEMCDSFSGFVPAAIEKLQDKAEAGDSGRNMEAMTDARIKTQILQELNSVNPRSGIYMTMSAHMGKQHQLDPYAAKEKKLAFLKADHTLKNVPEKFYFYTTTLWYTVRSVPLLTSTDKIPEYPRDSSDKTKGDTDLMEVEVMTLRNKCGPTGVCVTIVVSQSEGVLTALSDFHHCKVHGRYGIMGKDNNPTNLVNYFLELRPDVPLSRTTVRSKLNNDARLARAAEITRDMEQMQSVWRDFDDNLRCTPKELYEDLKKMGYDWDELLDTRPYWTFDQYTNEEKFLSTYDLLRMRKGLYHPFWMAPLVKTVKAEIPELEAPAKK